jgi:glycosyltransferase involved in cell wall biosynthesis
VKRHSPDADRPLSEAMPVILMISPLPPPYGGIARWTQMISNLGTTRTQVEIHIVDSSHATHHTDHTAVTRRLAAGLLMIFRVTFTFVGCAVRHRPDVVHINTSGHLGFIRDLVIIQISRLMRLPTLLHLRFGRIPSIIQKAGWELLLLRAVLTRASATVALDVETTEELRKNWPGLLLRQIPNFIDLSTLPKPRYGGPPKQALFVGSVLRSKGVDELLSAWHRLEPAGWQLDLVGEAPSRYLAQLTSGGLGHSVRLVGAMPHEQVLERIADCDLFILPSHTEGFPNVILEAMALGKPVVATDVGAIPDLLADGCGRLCQPQDVSSLLIAVEELISNDILRETLGKNARSRVQRSYGVGPVLTQYREIWEAAAQSSSRKLAL